MCVQLKACTVSAAAPASVRVSVLAAFQRCVMTPIHDKLDRLSPACPCAFSLKPAGVLMRRGCTTSLHQTCSPACIAWPADRLLPVCAACCFGSCRRVPPVSWLHPSPFGMIPSHDNIAMNFCCSMYVFPSCLQACLSPGCTPAYIYTPAFLPALHYMLTHLWSVCCLPSTAVRCV